MSLCSSEEISDFLTQYGWKFHIEHGVYLSGWQGQNNFYPLQISISDTFINIEVAPLLPIDSAIDLQRKEFWQYIHAINSEIQLFRLNVYDDKRIALSGQFFRQNFDFQLFSLSLGVIGYYSDQILEDYNNQVLSPFEQDYLN